MCPKKGPINHSILTFFTCKQVAKWEYFTSWHCERGAEIVFGTNLQFHNFVALNNERAGLEMVKMKGGNRVGQSPGESQRRAVGVVMLL